MARPRKFDKPEETKNINARIPKELAKKLKVWCAKNDITIQTFLIQAIDEKIKRQK